MGENPTIGGTGGGDFPCVHGYDYMGASCPQCAGNTSAKPIDATQLGSYGAVVVRAQAETIIAKLEAEVAGLREVLGGMTGLCRKFCLELIDGAENANEDVIDALVEHGPKLVHTADEALAQRPAEPEGT